MPTATLTFKRHRNPTKRQHFRGLAAGYRSGLEEAIGDEIKRLGIPLLYETEKVPYRIPSRDAKYTPDFKMPKVDGGFYYLETKGLWTVSDRAKHLLIQKQHPELDIRLLFSNANTKLYKGSPTSYKVYCEKHGLTWAHKHLPQDWIDESLAAVNQK